MTSVWHVLKHLSSFREAILFICPFTHNSSSSDRQLLSDFSLDFLVSVYLSSFRENIPSCAFSQKKITSSSNRQIRLIFFLDFPVSAYSNLRPALMSREKKKVQPLPPRTHPETLCTRFVFFFWFGPVEAQVILFTSEYARWIFRTCRRAGQIICPFFSWGKTTQGSHTEFCERVSYDINGWYQ